jgi:hypothetical protein
VQKWCTFSYRAAQQTKQLSSSCYKGKDKTFEQFSSLNESKDADKPTLEPILGCFHGPNESQRRSPYLELFSQPDKSKRVEKTLDLAIPSLFRLG